MTAKELGKAYDAWIVSRATSYQAAIFYGSATWIRTSYPTLEEAVKAARTSPRPLRTLVYAITEEGRHALVTRDMWPEA